MVEALVIFWNSLVHHSHSSLRIYLLGRSAMVNMDHSIPILLHDLVDEEGRQVLQAEVRKETKHDPSVDQRGKAEEVP